MICLYNFCWCVRTLSFKTDGIRVNQTPAMAAKLSDHIWTAEEFISFPSISKNNLYEELFEIHLNNTACLTANVLDSVS